MWQKVAKFKGAEYFRKALYIISGQKDRVVLSALEGCQFNSIKFKRALLAWETYVYIAKASEIDNKQKWNKQ